MRRDQPNAGCFDLVPARPLHHRDHSGSSSCAALSPPIAYYLSMFREVQKTFSKRIAFFEVAAIYYHTGSECSNSVIHIVLP